MKKILSAILIMVLVWGCSKKLAPATSGTATSNSGSVITQTTTAETKTGSTTSSTISSQPPPANTGTTGTKIAPTATTPDAAATIAGQATYNAKCGRCHGLKATIDYTAERWAGILAVMAPRANLTEAEKANVFAYVKENAKK